MASWKQPTLSPPTQLEHVSDLRDFNKMFEEVDLEKLLIYLDIYWESTLPFFETDYLLGSKSLMTFTIHFL